MARIPKSLHSRRLIVSRGAISMLALTLAGDPSSAVQLPPSGNEWPSYAGDMHSTKYSPLDLIDRNNVSSLRVAWRWSSPDNDLVSRTPSLHLNLFEGTPLLLAGVLYVSTNLHQVAAIDGATGRTRWVYDPGVYRLGVPKRLGFVHRGVATWERGVRRRIIVATGDAYLIALDAATGQPVPSFGEKGRVDLTKGLARPAERLLYGVNSPPLVIGDVIVVGSFLSDGWLRKEAPPGDVRGFDARSGRLLWTFHTIPQSGEPGGETWLEGSGSYTGAANVWTWMSADAALGYVYLPTSTPTDDHYGGNRPGDNLFAESIVCLEAKTGRRIWHFQTTHHGIWDYDLPAAPVLADITVDGRRIPALAQVSKQAFVYVLDRRTGRPVWPIEERAVPPSNVPGERTATTQPFPTRPAPFDLQGLRVEDLIDFTPELRAQARALIDHYDYGMLYTPPSERGLIQLPGIVGGASWAGAALDPESSVLFVPSVTRPSVVSIIRPDPSTSDLHFMTRRARPTLTLPNGLPITKPPYGRITASDLNTGAVRWQVAHGAGPRDHPALKGLNLPELGWPSRGFLLVTKTLLFAVQEPDLTQDFSADSSHFVFLAQTREPRLRAFDKRTGTQIAAIALPANAGGAPMTYAISGRQYVVIPVGGGGVPAELVALAVDGLKGPQDH
jgi:quinoprotein glucose dehydrogenase